MHTGVVLSSRVCCVACARPATARLTSKLSKLTCAMTGRSSQGTSSVSKAGTILDSFQNRRPKCVVLDLDYTVWPFWCEMYTVHDTPRLYPEAEGIIDACRERGILVTAASRTPTPNVARAFLRKTGLDEKFDNIQLIPAADGFDSYSAQKDTCHLPNIKAATKLDWNDMLFFDDESGNVRKVQRLGVCSVLVPTSIGLCCETFKQGLEKYAAQNHA